jgi:hypothetical protein
MVGKFILTLAGATVAGSAAFVTAPASAAEYCYYYYGYYYCRPAGDVGSDLRDIRRDRNELRWDYYYLRRDLETGRYGAAERDIDAIRRDRWELRRDYRVLDRDLYRGGY